MAEQATGSGPTAHDGGPDDARDPRDGSSDAPAAGSEDAPSSRDEHSAIDELGAYIRHQRESARLSLRKLSRLAGVSNPYLSQIERGLRKPSAEILQAIAKALEISSETLYVKAGILEEREPDDDLETVVRRDPYLTEAQQQALIEMYRSFRRLHELQGGPGRDDPQAGGRRRALLDVVSTGAVDDDAIRAASAHEEDESA